MNKDVRDSKDILISIVVPVYNVAGYLERTVKSIQNQSYENFEILLVDNGSTDGSSELVDQLAESDKRIIPIHEENSGVTHARLTGVSRAHGEWMGFVDSDDIIDDDMYKTLLENAMKYHADISHCGYQMCFADGRVHYFYNTKNIIVQDNLKGMIDLLDGSIVEPGLCNKLYRRELLLDLLRNHFMDYSIKNNEDLLMNFYLFKSSKKSVFYDFCPYHYIVRSNSASRGQKNKNQIYDPIKVKQQILENAPDEIATHAKIAYINTCIRIYNGLMSKEFRADRKQVKERIKEHRSWLQLADKKLRIMGFGILKMSFVYHGLYKMYMQFFQDKKYE